MNWADYALGILTGIILLLAVSVSVSIRLIRNPPEAILKAIGRNMARQVGKSMKSGIGS
jgi:hypothetical protein